MWRVIPLETRTAAENMAVDEAISDSVAAANVQPTIRFYRWKPSAVSIGCFQCIRDEVDVLSCESNHIDIVRRRTGGGAVYHDANGEITYSVIAPEELFDKDIKASYKEICSWIIEGLSVTGINARFRPINDVVVGNKKISGSAQTRRHGVLTQHGTILHSIDRATMFSVLKPSEKKLSDKATTSFEDYVTCALEQGCPSQQSLYNALLSGFTLEKNWKPDRLSEDEKAKAEKLVEKYESDMWNRSR